MLNEKRSRADDVREEEEKKDGAQEGTGGKDRS